MEGELADVAAKRRASRFIIDRLHVPPATPMKDGTIRDLLRDALLDEPALSHCRVREFVKGDLRPVRDPPAATGTLDIRVEDRVFTLDGDLTGLEQKRWLARSPGGFREAGTSSTGSVSRRPKRTMTSRSPTPCGWSWKRTRSSMLTSCGLVS
jgi:hypothetical protein